MPIVYLNARWSEITREERVFCAELYFLARENPGKLVQTLNVLNPGLQLPVEANWELGYEVCLYRDLLAHRGEPRNGSEYSVKRTFDLCLFSDEHLVILEAKAHEPFSAAQLEDFARDRQLIENLVGQPPKVHLVALASSRYFENQEKHGRSGLLGLFDGRVSWRQLAEMFPSELLSRADAIYRPGTRETV